MLVRNRKTGIGPAEEIQPDTPQQPDETAQAEQPDTSVSVAQAGTAVYTEQLAAGVTVTYDPNGGDSATVSASVTPGQPYGAQPEAAVASLLAQLDAAHISLEGGGDHV